MTKAVIGHIEKVDFPKLGFSCFAKTDTGACTSALHADDIRVEEIAGEPIATFTVKFKSDTQTLNISCQSPLIGQREIKSSNGQKSTRYVIKTPAVIAGQTYDIELTLSHRGNMTYPMLLGRKAISGRFLVDVSISEVDI
jgi:hypothetical protein